MSTDLRPTCTECTHSEGRLNPLGEVALDATAPLVCRNHQSWNYGCLVDPGDSCPYASAKEPKRAKQ